MLRIPAKLSLISVLGFVLIAPGCRTAPAPGESGRQPAAEPAQPATLVGTEWTCVEIEGAPVDRAVRAPTLRFDDDGRISGSTAVNRYGATCELVRGAQAFAIRIGPVLATRMAGDQASMRVESSFTRALGSVDSAKVVGASLELWSGKARVLRFDRAAE